jgi:hypothetical protein
MRTGVLKLADINNDLLHQHTKSKLHALEYTYTLPNQSKSIKLIDIIHHFPYNVIFLLYFIIFYIVHCKITYATTFTKILS